MGALSAFTLARCHHLMVPPALRSWRIALPCFPLLPAAILALVMATGRLWQRPQLEWLDLSGSRLTLGSLSEGVTTQARVHLL